jgi:hypothetical protein
LHFFKKKKGQRLKYEKASQELFSNYFAVRNLCKNLVEKEESSRVGKSGEGLIPGSSGKERLTRRKYRFDSVRERKE